MPSKNSNSVALERRVDLASLFCMIGRHGPAVALAVIAMVSVVAGFIIYRTVRGKRRKATAGAADTDGNDAGAETLIPPDEEPELSLEELRSSAESTGVSDGGSLEDTTLKIRHRRAAAERQPPPCRHSNSDSLQENEHKTSVEQVAEAHAEEEEDTGAEIDVETNLTNGTIKDAEDESENEVIQSHKGELKVLEEKFQQDDPVPTETNVSNEEISQEEENLVSKSTEFSLEEPIIHIEGICYAKDVKCEEKDLHADGTDFSDYSNNHPFPEEGKKSGGEESLDDQLTSQQAEISSTGFDQVTDLQGQCHAFDEVMLSFQQDADEGHLSDSTDIKFKGHLLQLAEQKNNGLACNQDNVVKREMPTGEDIASCGEENNGSAVVLDSTLPCLNQIVEPEKLDDGDASLSSITNNATAQSSDIVQIPVLSSGHLQPQSNVDEDDIAQSVGVISGAAPVTSEDSKPPMLQIHLPSFEQVELTWSSCGLGGESGISSMTVSPDLPDVINECDQPSENVALPGKDNDAQFEEQIEVQNILLAGDVALSAINEDLEKVVSRSCLLHLSQQSLGEQMDWAIDRSFAANEDVLGHEIEDSYYRELDQIMAQMAANVTSVTDELTVKADVKAVKIKQKMEGAEKEEEDYEKTEISIMEATMDNNEWITDGNYQVLPWMNQPVSLFAPNHTQPDSVSPEDHQSASFADATCIDADVSPSSEVRQTRSLSPVNENVENGKKVVAVQPMPQSVNVTFRIHYLTHSPYQKVAITGNQQELGNWKEFIPLERAKDGHWAAVVSLPAESLVEWKFVVLDKGEVCRWEECGNRLLDTGFGADLLVHKWWGFL
ncbi:uncharacterized protein stbd1 [Archocentrus centrarchus]|uniref:uncharacterized protein stbd1 n=1 Tax=Archocentrus centrarchus TaxID=63155 RepID=UPI0011E9E22D|nr:starch-binding domain-containing protein 1 [Archocentrus centrarchus]